MYTTTLRAIYKIYPRLNLLSNSQQSPAMAFRLTKVLSEIIDILKISEPLYNALFEILEVSENRFVREYNALMDELVELPGIKMRLHDIPAHVLVEDISAHQLRESLHCLYR